MLSLQEPRWDPCSSPENQRSGRSPFVFKAPRPSQALIDPVIRFIFSMKVCLFILENLGSKKRIQTKKKVNPSLDTKHNYYSSFCAFALSVHRVVGVFESCII